MVQFIQSLPKFRGDGDTPVHILRGSLSTQTSFGIPSWMGSSHPPIRRGLAIGISESSFRSFRIHAYWSKKYKDIYKYTYKYIYICQCIVLWFRIAVVCPTICSVFFEMHPRWLAKPLLPIPVQIVSGYYHIGRHQWHQGMLFTCMHVSPIEPRKRPVLIPQHIYILHAILTCGTVLSNWESNCHADLDGHPKHLAKAWFENPIPPEMLTFCLLWRVWLWRVSIFIIWARILFGCLLTSIVISIWLNRIPTLRWSDFYPKLRKPPSQNVNARVQRKKLMISGPFVLGRVVFLVSWIYGLCIWMFVQEIWVGCLVLWVFFGGVLVVLNAWDVGSIFLLRRVSVRTRDFAGERIQ